MSANEPGTPTKKTERSFAYEEDFANSAIELKDITAKIEESNSALEVKKQGSSGTYQQINSNATSASASLNDQTLDATVQMDDDDSDISDEIDAEISHLED